MNCPKCESENVIEVDNLHMIWKCFDCGHEGDGEDFDTNETDPFCVPAIQSGDFDISEYERRFV